MNTIKARLNIDNCVCARVQCDAGVTARVGVGTVVASEGTKDYNRLINQPSIENETLIGNKTIDQIGVGTLTVQEIERILYLGEEI